MIPGASHAGSPVQKPVSLLEYPLMLWYNAVYGLETAQIYVADTGDFPGYMRSDRYKKRKKNRTSVVLTAVIAAAALLGTIIYLNFYGNIRTEIRSEAGDPVPSAQAFIKRPSSSIKVLQGTEGISETVPGTYTVEFKWLLFRKKARLVIEDTTAPSGTVRDITAATGTQIEASQFVVSAEDISGVSATYKNIPDFDAEGTREVTINLTDAYGNVTGLAAELTLMDDTQAPQILGAINRTVYVGETISYRSGVTVEDNKDPSPKLSIDNSQVDLDTIGRYPVTYTATDAVGNSSSVTITVNVEERPAGYENIEDLYALADKLLAQLFPGGNIAASSLNLNEQIETAYTVFRWIRTNVPWYGGRIEHNYVEQAMKALQGNSGDCYTCTVGCKVLLERLGFEVMLLERTNAIGRHSWLMVKIGDSWYHMDPAPIYVQTFICFLGTDEQLLAFNELRPDYYTHDWAQYPATPLESPAEVVLKNGKYALVIK